MNPSFKKNIIFLGLVSLLNDLSSEMILPLLPSFLSGLGAGAFVIGLVGGVRRAVESLFKVIGGASSDKLSKRKPFIFCGYLASGVFKFFLSFARIWWQALLFVGLERVGKGIRTAPRDALIASSVSRNKSGAFGLHRAFDTAGAILGVLVSFFLYQVFHFKIREIIALGGAISLISLVFLKSVREVNPGKTKKYVFTLSIKNLPLEFRKFIIPSFLFSLANFSYMFFLLKCQDFLKTALYIPYSIIFYLIFNIFYAGLSYPFGVLADKWGRKNIIICGFLLFAVVSVGFAFLKNIIGAVVLFSLYGVVYALLDGNMRAYVDETSSREEKATSFGLYHSLNSLGVLVGNLVAGALWQFWGAEFAFFYAAFLLMSAVLFLYKI